MPSQRRDRLAPYPWRAGALILAATVGLAVAGFLIGVRQSAATSNRAPSHAHHEVVEDPDLPQAPTYGQRPRYAIGPNRDYQSHLENRAEPRRDPLAPVDPQPQRRPEALAERAANRAFAGAPPTVPHPMTQTSAASCLACHRDGIDMGQVVAPKISHAEFANCTQCHVEQDRQKLEASHGHEWLDNRFAGQPEPDGGKRAWPGAPPTIPHPTHMRENCLACHGSLGDAGIQTSHPWRDSCNQCHAPSAERDQRDFDTDTLRQLHQQMQELGSREVGR